MPALLSRNLKYLRSQRKLTQAQLAEIIEVSRATYGDYENGNSEPPAGKLKQLGAYFHCSLDDLMGSDMGAPLFQKQKNGTPLSNEDFRVIAITVQADRRENIEFVPVKAFAGYTSSYSDPEFIESLPHFTLPKHEAGTYRAFEVQGDSMPPVDEGFIVIGRYVEHLRNVSSGKRYVVILREDGVVFKRVILDDHSGRQMLLMSDNPVYPPFYIHTSEVLEAWEMVSYIAFPQQMVSHENIIFDKLHAIERRIEHLCHHKS